MQILNSQWINCVIFFFFFFLWILLEISEDCQTKDKGDGFNLSRRGVSRDIIRAGYGSGAGAGAVTCSSRGRNERNSLIFQPLKKSVNRAQTQNYKQHVPYTDMYECKNEWMWMNKWMNEWMNEWMNKWMNNWKTWRVNKWMNDRNGQSINQHKKAREAGENSISCHLRVGRVSDNRLTKPFGQERELKISRKRRKSRQTDKARD